MQFTVAIFDLIFCFSCWVLKLKLTPTVNAYWCDWFSIILYSHDFNYVPSSIQITLQIPLFFQHLIFIANVSSVASLKLQSTEYFNQNWSRRAILKSWEILNKCSWAWQIFTDVVFDFFNFQIFFIQNLSILKWFRYPVRNLQRFVRDQFNFSVL